MPPIVLIAHGLEKKSITQTKYVNKNQHGTDKTHPRALEKIPAIDAKKPKPIRKETMGNIKRFVIGDTKDILPKL